MKCKCVFTGQILWARFDKTVAEINSDVCFHSVCVCVISIDERNYVVITK